jgi:ribosomal protein S18 acetylase RimI-like enzyme
MSDSIAFGSSYEEEIMFSDEEWVNRIKNVLFAILDDKPIRMIVYIFNKGLKIKHIANIYGVYLKKEYRRQGVGKKLLENAISLILMNINIVKINLSANPLQVAAVKLYVKYGFESVGILKNDLLFEDKFYDEVVMEKHIIESLNSD